MLISTWYLQHGLRELITQAPTFSMLCMYCSKRVVVTGIVDPQPNPGLSKCPIITVPGYI